jgi:hypothetical protein
MQDGLQELHTMNETGPNLEGEIDRLGETALRVKTERDALEAALKASVGYMLNAKIDLETGAPKVTAIRTIEGGIKMAREALETAGA